MVIGERLRMLVENSQLQTPNGPIGVTVSAGATLARDDDTLTSLVRRADELLYRSKERGKNCLTCD